MQTLIPPPHVLVVDADKSDRKQLRKALPEMDLTFVPDAERAIAAATRREPAVVLMAYDMPTTDGFDLLIRLRVHPETMDIPVVLLTADPDRAQRPPSEGQPTTMILAREDLGLLKEYVPKFRNEKTMMKSFREAYSRVLWGAARAASELTGDERTVLESAGFPVDTKVVDPSPVAARAARYQHILSTSLTTQRAAKKLGVNASRVRQRLLAMPAELYGIRTGNEWLLPAFQFGTKGLVPNIDKVIARLSPGIDPVAVDGWFRRANIDLVHDGQSLSPLEWLAQGLQFEPVANLAEDI
jgi:CheY-like chemotaxis protein